MDDPYDAVRYAAGHALQSLPGFEHYAYDFTVRPHQRERVAGDVAQRGAPGARAAQLSPELPFTPEGLLQSELTQALLSRRDGRPVHLLE
jgi:DNA-binding LytR/AlgR family response regulator